MTEYLRFEDPQVPDELAYELMHQHLILAPAVIGGFLEKARDYLLNTLGPNQQKRKDLEPDWLGYWITSIKLLGENVRNIRTQRFGDIDFIGRKFIELNSGLTTGFCTMATGEGTPGHRYFVDSTFDQVSKLCIGLEGSGYFDRNPNRRRPFLPLALRVSMWLLYNKDNYVTILPAQDTFSTTIHYRQLCRRTNAILSLASVDDPNAQEKAFRGFKPSTLISEFSVHTSERVERLMPEFEEIEEEPEEFMWCER